jgi:hypothetical protein
LATLGEALPQESDQFLLGTKMDLFPAVDLFNGAFHPACRAFANNPKLNHKCSAHSEFRIWLLTPPRVDISWNSCQFFVHSIVSDTAAEFLRTFIKENQPHHRGIAPKSLSVRVQRSEDLFDLAAFTRRTIPPLE